MKEYKIIITNAEERVVRNETFLTREEAWNALNALFMAEVEDRCYNLTHDDQGNYTWPECKERWFVRYLNATRGLCSAATHASSRLSPIRITRKRLYWAKVNNKREKHNYSLYMIVEQDN